MGNLKALVRRPRFIENIHRDIYDCKVNRLIPWALIAGDQEWLGSGGEYKDGSMGKAFAIRRDGSVDGQTAIIISSRFHGQDSPVCRWRK